MRKYLNLAVAAAALAVAAPAFAETRIGVVDLQAALNDVEEGKVAKAALKKEFDAKQKVVQEREDDVRKLQAEFQKQQAVMNEQSRAQKGEEIARKAQELQGTFMKMQQELSERERELTRGIFDKMQAIVREIAVADGLTAVLDRQAVIFADPSLDITGELIRKYNTRHKPAAGAAATPAKATEAKKPAAKPAAPKPAAK